MCKFDSPFKRTSFCLQITWWLGYPLLVCSHWIFFCYISEHLEAVKAFISAECNVGDLRVSIILTAGASLIHTQTQMHMCRLIGWLVCVWFWSSQQKQPLLLPEAISRRKTLTNPERDNHIRTQHQREPIRLCWAARKEEYHAVVWQKDWICLLYYI